MNSIFRKRINSLCLAFMFALFYVSGLHAQTDGDEGYKVVLQKYNLTSSDYEDYLTLEAEGSEENIEIDEVLDDGFYRYKILAKNPGMKKKKKDYSDRDDWHEFVIGNKEKPVIEAVYNEKTGKNRIYIDDSEKSRLIVEGKNLYKIAGDEKEVAATEYRLIKTSDYKERGHSVKFGGDEFETFPFSIGAEALVPLECDVTDENKVSLLFDYDLLKVGKYYLFAKNTDGTESKKNHGSLVKISYKKLCDFDVSAGYMLPFVLYDSVIPDYMGTHVFPLSFTGKLSFMPLKQQFGNFGFSALATYTRMDFDSGAYKVGGNLMSFHLNAVYNYKYQKFKYEVCAGAGIFDFSNFEFNYYDGSSSPKLTSIDFSVNVGTSVYYYVTRHFYAELALDFMTSSTSDFSLGIIYPAIYVGWEF